LLKISQRFVFDNVKIWTRLCGSAVLAGGFGLRLRRLILLREHIPQGGNTYITPHSHHSWCFRVSNRSYCCGFGIPVDPVDSWIGLRTDDGLATIASVRFSGLSVVLDDLTFSTVPAPGSAGLLVGFAGVASAWCRRA